MKIIKSGVWVAAGLSVVGCLASDTSTDGTVVQETDPTVTVAVFTGRVCDAPIYAAFLGYYEGEFVRADESLGRSCQWSVNMEFVGNSIDDLCVVTGIVATEILFQEPNTESPYSCAVMNDVFNIPADVAPGNLNELVLPQSFSVDFDEEAVIPFDEFGLPLFYPVTNPESVTVDENLLLQFDFGTLTRIGDEAPL